MKKIILLMMSTALAWSTYAQSSNIRVAVFDPTSTSINEGKKIAIRELISATIVNSGNYTLVERSMLEKVMQEQSFSNSGVVDDTQATEIGKLAGANKIILSVVVPTGNQIIFKKMAIVNYMLSIKMIDVKTANVERHQTKEVKSSDLLNSVKKMTLSLIDKPKVQNIKRTLTPQQADVNEDKYKNKNKADDKQEQEIENNINEPVSNNYLSEAYQGNFTYFKVPDHLAPRENEIVFYLPAGYIPAKEEDKYLPLVVYFNEQAIGSGTIYTGFCVRMPNPGPGEHTLKVGSQRIKFNTDAFNFFELQIKGKNYYSISIKEQKMAR